MLTRLAVLIALTPPAAADPFARQLQQAEETLRASQDKPRPVRASFRLQQNTAANKDRGEAERLRALQEIATGIDNPPLDRLGKPVSVDDSIDFLYSFAASGKMPLKLRLAALEHLTRVPGERSTIWLETLWAGDEKGGERQPPAIREGAAGALLARKETLVFERFWDPREKKPRELRYDALIELAKSNSPAGIDALLEALFTEDQWQEARLAAAVGLGKLSREALAASVPPSDSGYSELKVGQPILEQVHNALGKDCPADPDELVRAACNQAIDLIERTVKT